MDQDNPTPERAEDSPPHTAPAPAAEVLPAVLPILPLANRPFFPALAMPLVMDEERWLDTVKAAVEAEHKMVGLVLVDTDSVDEAGVDNFFAMGTACRIYKVERVEDNVQVLLEGLQRFRIRRWISTERPFAARVEYFPEVDSGDSDELKAYTLAIINTIKALLPLNPLYGEELKIFLQRFGPEQPSRLADFSASLTSASKHELQNVLEAVDLIERLEKVLLLLKKEVEVAQAQAKIHKQVEEKISARQREFFLREQLKAIQKELGLAKDDRTAELEKFKARIKTLALSDSARKRVNEEMDKLAVLETGSPEFAVTRNYLDWITALPWGRYSEDNLDLKHAKEVLDQDHDGLDDVKERIVEFLAVGALKGEIAGSIILLVGPPGVGKTSIGRSIARALNRRFYRFSVGGMRDEAEIKGHRRTYIGAMPGKVIQALKEVDVANPVIMLDEMDKIGASYQGDPASALLEVLDPEQNSSFLDHYLDLRFDLSKALFIGTANQLDTIPRPLLDRMEVIRLAGYIASEKVNIALNHLLPRQVERAGLRKSQLRLAKTAVAHIAEHYAREAGVRNLEKRIAAICRKAAVKILEGEQAPIRVNSKNLEDYLGKPVFRKERPATGIGVVTGLAWTPLGGATLSIEATRVHELARGFKLTGQLGGVMKESAEIAYSYVLSHAFDFGANPEFFDKAFIHLHVPAGATPKDGPSAGITMATALLSLARGEQTRRRIAMTGELTLSGDILPVGGIREKAIAARRVGIKDIILPGSNRADFDEIPSHIKAGMKAHFVEVYGDVVNIVFARSR